MHTLLLSLAALAAMPSEETVKAYSDQTVKYTGGEYKDETFHYRLLAPKKIEPGKKYPLILFLHGAGERGDDNKSQLQYLPELMASDEYRTKYPCFLIAPQCREKRQWSAAPFGEKESTPLKEPSDQMKAALQILDEVIKSNPVDEKRLYLTGLSMGGYGSWELATRMPDRFAAVVPICGGGDEHWADHLVNVPIWAWHGDADPAVPVERSRKMIEAIKQSGGHPKYTELKGVGHNSWTPAYSDPDGPIPWMFEHVKS